MKPTLPPELVRRSLDAHSAIGLVVGALMYLICLTGTLAVLMESFERWEQPQVSEFETATPEAVANAVANYRAHMARESADAPGHLWVVMPVPTLPRMHVADEEQEWWTDSAGNFEDAPAAHWTEMLVALHVHLHLPQNIGIVLVSAAGAMLIALIVSGVFAHPRLFRDAFKFRRGGAKRLAQADLHNRLSVWGLPFHLMIAVTGAFYGLVGILVFTAAALFYDGDSDALFAEIYGGDPALEAPVIDVDTGAAMRHLADHAPGVTPLYLVIHDLDTPAQFMEIAASVPGRLAYSEIYRYDAAGEFLGSQELTTGPAGRQFLYSLYRIHFGAFGGHLTRITWVVLGLALTVVSATGVNIWLARRGRTDWINHAWAGFVWGSPLALAASAFASLALGVSPIAVFCAALVASLAYSLWRAAPLAAAGRLQHLCGATCIALAAWHAATLVHAHIDPVSHWLNGAIALGGLVLLVMGRRNTAGEPVVTREAIAGNPGA